jgi:hypothetical protein
MDDVVREGGEGGGDQHRVSKHMATRVTVSLQSQHQHTITPQSHITHTTDIQSHTTCLDVRASVCVQSVIGA